MYNLEHIYTRTLAYQRNLSKLNVVNIRQGPESLERYCHIACKHI